MTHGMNPWNHAIMGKIPIFELPQDKYNQIMEECCLGVDSDEEDVDDEQEGVIDLEDYIAEIQEKDKEWAKKYRIQYL